MPVTPLLSATVRRIRALAVLTSLFALSLAGCANGGAPGDSAELSELGQGLAGPPRAEIVAAAGRLPHRLGIVFERTREVSSDGGTGLMARYDLKGTGAWATVFVYDEGYATVPDGLASEVLTAVHAGNMQVARGNATNGIAQQSVMTVPGAPPQRCAISRAMREGRSVANYGCATGVRNVILKVRVTATMPAGNPQEQEMVDKIVAVLLADVTRTVAGLPPLSVGTAPPNAPVEAPITGPSGRRLRL